MKRMASGLLCLAGLFCAAGAQAVVLSAGGQGQVLIFPYYTVNAGNTSLILLQNNSERGKVVQLRFAEGDIGDTGAVFNVYIAARDSWSGAVIAAGASGAVLTTRDTSCTAPVLETTADGLRFLPLTVPDRRPGGLPSQTRAKEGWIEAIEVATIQTGTPTANALRTGDGRVRDCGFISQAWTAPGGFWIAQPRRDLLNPSGGISGYSAVINVAAGTFFSLPATALEEFRVDPADTSPQGSASVVQHRPPTPANLLTLADAVSDPATGVVQATVIAGSRVLRLSYPRAQAIDAVSAALAAAEISGDFEVSPELGATTTFLQVYPTRRFYTDPALLPAGATAALPPFSNLYYVDSPQQPSELRHVKIVDREGLVLIDSDGPHFGGCNTASRQRGEAVSMTIPFGGTADPLLGSRFHGTMNLACGGDTGSPAQRSGSVILSPGKSINSPDPLQLRPSREGKSLVGLPVIGARLTNYVNANVQQGVLANYSGAVPLTSRAECLDAGGAKCEP